MPSLKGNIFKKGGVDMNGYTLIFLLLHKIEELQEELEKYQEEQNKN